ncbi:hypothetical protein FA95DRAFT_1561964 [Auriscalpium vulgare]|uniref:Uncharacterized protein n=1 Tax=Auriscalpium vulgare TaxID=40419 RepID=A0ACB8RLE2_9AGAM|nr:hypothetical protein FA95DRAFT_1561964 [Auriscalpium vulgare]
MSEAARAHIADVLAFESPFPPDSLVPHGALRDYEEWWVKHRDWLQERGYRLRRRYQPNWEPSWNIGKESHVRYEDGQAGLYWRILDAVRISDGAYVVFKKIPTASVVHEVEVNELLCTPPLVNDPRNHCAPLLEVLEVPDEPGQKIIVMPQLRPHDDPNFDTIGEAFAFFTQIFEGLQFIHENHVAHRDCTLANICMDPGMFPKPFHPVNLQMRRDWKGKARYYTRTQRPPRYFFIDFGLSGIYPPESGPPLDKPYRGGDRTAPEHVDTSIPCNPFPTDVYYLGNLIRECFILRYHGFSMMQPLVNDMVAQEPAKRPQMDEVVTRFKAIRASVTSWKMRSRMVRRDEDFVVKVYRATGHWYRRLGYILTRTPAIPDA